MNYYTLETALSGKHNDKFPPGGGGGGGMGGAGGPKTRVSAEQDRSG